MPRWRNISVSYNELLELDPNTAITITGLRRLVNDGDIPHIRIGRKILLDLDNLFEFLSLPNHTNKPCDSDISVQVNGIRKVS